MVFSLEPLYLIFNLKSSWSIYNTSKKKILRQSLQTCHVMLALHWTKFGFSKHTLLITLMQICSSIRTCSCCWNENISLTHEVLCQIHCEKVCERRSFWLSRKNTSVSHNIHCVCSNQNAHIWTFSQRGVMLSTETNEGQRQAFLVNVWLGPHSDTCGHYFYNIESLLLLCLDLALSAQVCPPFTPPTNTPTANMWPISCHKTPS